MTAEAIDRLLTPCLSSHPACAQAPGTVEERVEGQLATPMPALADEEGAALPKGLPEVIDGHVHLFPERLFEAIWDWFHEHGWPIRYQLHAEAVLQFLFERGVSRVVALHYAHKPGIARDMNQWMSSLVARWPRVLGTATVFPGEEGAVEILREAFALGLGGVKLHCHVQCFGPDEPAMHEVYSTCAEHSMPLVIHAGREPKSPAYHCDPHELCAASKIERALTDYPDLRICVPHLGADEFDAYARLLERHDNLWLDTTMMLADYFSLEGAWPLLEVRPDRVLYGTDFPNLPYAWDREVRRLASRGLRDEHLEQVLGGVARDLFGLDPL